MSNSNSPIQQFTAQSVAFTKRLPSLPSVARYMLEIAQQEEPDMRELCKVIRVDPAVCGKILRTVNSALFAIRPKIESIEVAVTRLGLSAIRTLILSFHLSSWRTSSRKMKRAFESAMRSCLTQAVIAEMLAEKAKLDPAACFTGGLVQDIGTLAMIAELEDDYTGGCASQPNESDSIAKEKELFGFTHVDVGVEILKKWNMGDEFIEAVRSHHNEGKNLKPSAGISLASVLKLASMGEDLLKGHADSATVDVKVHQWMKELNSQLGLSPEDVKDVVDEIEERVSEYSAIYSFEISEDHGIESIVERAKELLEEIALESQMQIVAARRTIPANTDDAMYRDYLTGLHNRRYLNEIAKKQFQSWVDECRPAAVFFLDVDDFKSINDTFGHTAGDYAIKHAAAWLRRCTREDDHVIRMGGDEFLILMQVDEAQFESVLQRLTTELPPFRCSSGDEILISVSVGSVHYAPSAGNKNPDLDSLIRQADKQMYLEKEAAKKVFFGR